MENPFFKVGDIISSTFHYTAQFVYFYKVVSTTRTTIDVVETNRRVVSDDGYGQNGTMVTDGVVINPSRIKRFYAVTKPVIYKECTTIEKWDGKPIDFYTD